MKSTKNNCGNIVSVSWGDHLMFGEDDGKLSTPGALERRMKCWHDELGADTLHWRQVRSAMSGHFFVEKGRKHPLENVKKYLTWDDFEVVPKLAHDNGMKANLYVSLFDEGWSLPSREEREISYHNNMHGQHVSWQSSFSHEHPEYAVLDRNGSTRQWGVLCLAYEEVRKYFVKLYLELLDEYDFDGLFVCFRSQSKPAEFADQFNFNEPVRRDFQKIYGKDILKDDFNLQDWRDLVGKYITDFLRVLKNELRKKNRSLSIGLARGDVIGPPLGNTTLQWREWIQDGLVDNLIINQSSCQCPSIHHKLWPMHNGSGYVQNYLDSCNLPPIEKHLNESYFPIVSKSSVNLYVARQWNQRSEKEEMELLNNPSVSGLVFSSFRFDNPGPLARNNWVA